MITLQSINLLLPIFIVLFILMLFLPSNILSYTETISSFERIDVVNKTLFVPAGETIYFEFSTPLGNKNITTGPIAFQGIYGESNSRDVFVALYDSSSCESFIESKDFDLDSCDMVYSVSSSVSVINKELPPGKYYLAFKNNNDESVQIDGCFMAFFNIFETNLNNDNIKNEGKEELMSDMLDFGYKLMPPYC